ncbi:MAG: hypothetical protein PWQ96_262 [Clostridia bacterium]|nr:hypothetical protein [Clostridia bacterium]
MIPVKECIKRDLNKIAAIMEKDFNLRAGHLNDFMEFHIESAKELYYPLLLLGSFRLLSKAKKPPYHMVAVIQFINMATNIHKYKGDFPQYPVLVGDYLYTKFFSYLCQYKSLKWLQPLSQVICNIHEGGIERKENQDKGKSIGIETLKKEVANLSAISCEIGATYAQDSHLVISSMKEVGFNLGLAWAITEEYSGTNSIKRLPSSDVNIYLEKAKNKLFTLSKYVANREILAVFEEIIFEINKNNSKTASSQVV